MMYVSLQQNHLLRLDPSCISFVHILCYCILSQLTVLKPWLDTCIYLIATPINFDVVDCCSRAAILIGTSQDAVLHRLGSSSR